MGGPDDACIGTIAVVSRRSRDRGPYQTTGRLERVYDGGVLFFPRWKRRGRGRRDAVDEDPWAAWK